MLEAGNVKVTFFHEQIPYAYKNDKQEKKNVSKEMLIVSTKLRGSKTAMKKSWRHVPSSPGRRWSSEVARHCITPSTVQFINSPHDVTS